MNILITAGGTIERIDPVRSITNSSTGRLGSIIAERFAMDDAVESIYYICPRAAARPHSEKVKIINITDTAELESVIRGTLQNERIDAVIQSMAVSDYRVRSVTNSGLLAGSLQNKLAAGASAEDIAELILSAEGLNNTEKLSSSEKDLIVMLEPVPKIISMFRRYAPQALLVGFKLLDGAAHDKLLDAAYALMEQNACTFVLANDKREIDSERHIGYLIDRGHGQRRFETKQQIADGIAEAVLTSLRGRGKP